MLLEAGPSDDVRAVLEAVRPLVERALLLAGQTHTLDDVAEAIEANQAQLWQGPHSIVVTEVLEAPRRKLIHFWLAAGRLEELRAMESTILDWAKSLGCDRATLTGRPGWTRSWLSKKWKSDMQVMTRELD